MNLKILSAFLLFVLTGLLPLVSAYQYNIGSVSEYKVVLYLYEKDIAIDDGVVYHAYVINGTVPAPPIKVRVGDKVDVTIINNGTMLHGIDFHAALLAPSKYFIPVKPGEKFEFSFIAKYPGVFIYHCAPGGIDNTGIHIANGMAGVIIVEPSNLPPVAAEYILVKNEFYKSYQDYISGNPLYVTFDGYNFRYLNNPLPVPVNKTVRLYVLNIGPNLWLSFHIIGTILDTVYLNGNPNNVFKGLQSISLEPDQGAIIDVVFPEPGKYPFVDHAFNHASKGAAGAFIAITNFTSTTPGTGQGLAVIPFKPPYTVISWAMQTTQTTTQISGTSDIISIMSIITIISIILASTAMMISIRGLKRK
jgi:nitrite reductase (NO-forming)